MPAAFDKVPTDLDFPKEEREVLAFWKEARVFERSVESGGGESGAGRPSFVFYEGPPTANGMPHNGHVLTRVIKDLFPRYKTMRGYNVARKGGWDTHGLPVEVEVEKELRIHGKAAIQAYGVEPFVKRCIESVFRYTDEWEKLTERIGFWVDLPDAYVTFHKSYVESVWWALSELFKKGLLYQGHKVVWWWAQGGTALSAGEVGLGYKQVDDPSAYVAFALVDEPEISLLVWTTTPWTLPSNAYAAVHANVEYVVARFGERQFIVAKALVESLAKKLKTEAVVVRTLKGSDLVGKTYVPPFDLYYGSMKGSVVGRRSGEFVAPYWRIIAADFVTLDTGTGIVHVAPAFGEDDFTAHRAELAQLTNPQAVPLLCAVAPDGTFVPELPRYAGRWVKDCDKEILAELRANASLVFAETYRHDYPFCWRADQDPLIQYARPAWYIQTTAFIDQAIANNRAVQWLPEHIKEGRFGDLLAHNVDWALSRERFWGTPLNVWINDQTGKMEAPSSVADILAKNPSAFDHFHAAKKLDPSLSEHLLVHKPWIDHVTWQNPDEDGTYRRVPEVIDCWFDSGCVPFAQWGFPHTGVEAFRRAFPADFISEGIDQTRGWFYSLLMISTLVFDEECQKRLGLDPIRPFPHPYKTCIVLGHTLDKEGKKESKSKGNYTPPEVILDEVKMDFAVVDAAGASSIKGVSFQEAVAAATAFIAAEDLEGLDLVAPANVVLRGPGEERAFTLQSKKGLPRRLVVLNADDAKALGVHTTKTVDVKPVEVPRLPPTERVSIRDPETPAPGADAFRWFFYASNPPWSSTRHSLSNVRAFQKEFLVKLRNVYSFFTIYANIDAFDPKDSASERRAPPHDKRPELDRWILSELSHTVATVSARLDAYDVYGATGILTDLVDALSNWYVRRSRDRFWRAGWDADKSSAYATLYEVLVTLTKAIAPFVPFTAEKMFQNLVVGPAKASATSAPVSVHLASFPDDDGSRFVPALSSKIKAVRELVSLGLQVRTQAKIKVRQPLQSAFVIVVDRGPLQDASSLLLDELNVRELHFVELERAETYVEYRLKPNFRTLGQRGLGKQAQELKKQMAALSPAEAARLAGTVLATGKVLVSGIELQREDVEIEFVAKEGFAAAGDRGGVVVLDTTLTDDLREQGFVRELQNRVQTLRKDSGLEYTDAIDLWIVGGDPVTRALRGRHAKDLQSAVLARTLSTDLPPEGLVGHDVDVEEERVVIHMAKRV